MSIDEHHHDGAKVTDRPVAALILALSLAAGILLPSIVYAVVLRPSNPADVLVASSICLFSAIVYLWTLHATSIVPFRDPWMSKSIFGAAIVAILGTCTAAVATQLSASPHPREGTWEIRLRRVDPNTQNRSCVWDGKIILAYSSSRSSYVGYAEDKGENACEYGVRSIRLVDWQEKTNELQVTIRNFPANDAHPADKLVPTEQLSFVMDGGPGRWSSKQSSNQTTSYLYAFEMLRPE
ncbi:hypothetical protein GGD63_006292 [Bradyrhizobium sp. cir1]|uniref:hypothetical protein n=1 Tax=Bradyrhizobium sp. cir1 TaxID=1445730 RepID=UPI001606EFEE|nr:hypothetical protein [Bradyrhizobium sp. cir1]MBB4373469.1 hypothetical protein [Bradyrhizobium sp. cir1]